ncbi:MAG: DNA gyrase subunit A, partial [Myxococcota bacterium]
PERAPLDPTDPTDPPEPFAKHIIPVRIEDEMRSSYLDYSMSVIIGRALPDVRDGLKPVHRRILYAMDQEGLQSNRKYSKCAGVVGEVLKKYHPHGDSAVYDALVRMAQPWNLRYPLVDGQGNFGSVDGDPPAAYRYTECRMTKLAEELMVDIDKETVGFVPNYDGSTGEPEVLPSAFPNLLVNGADGIAVGMATKIPPHNLGEIIDACIAVIANPQLPVAELLEMVPGPDFPTGGTIFGRQGIRDAYLTGRGRIIVRGRAAFEEVHGRQAIVIDEIPYQVNKSRLIEEIADLVREKKLDGIHTLRDESDRHGMRIVIELKHDAFEEVVLNHLYKHTALQSTFGAILIAIVNNRPRVLSLLELIQHYIAHRREVVLRRTRYLLRKAKERAHILEGYRIALDHIDAVIALIRASRTVEEARTGLIAQFGLSEIQANAILEMRLQRLTGLERDKIEEEYAEVLLQIGGYEEILGSEQRLMGVVSDELIEVRGRYADERRTRIVDAQSALTVRDLVAEENQVVTLSHLGYIKRVSPDEWGLQKRGGMGKKGMDTRDEDFVTSIFVANTHAVLLVFTTGGKVFPLNVYEVPESGRAARGRPIVNLVQIPPGEQLASVVSVSSLTEDDPRDLLFASKLGLVKRTPLSAFANMRQGGLIACGVADDDELRLVKLLDPNDPLDIMMLSRKGLSIRFPMGGPKGAPVYGRSARGNIGMKLGKDDEVVGMLLVPHSEAEDIPDELDVDEVVVAVDEDDVVDGELVEEPDVATILTVTSTGFGKRTPLDAFRTQGRNGKGIIAHATGAATLVTGQQVTPEDQLMLVTDTGRVIRISAGDVRLVQSRSSKGVRMMRLEPGERIVDLELLPVTPDVPTSATEAPSEE